jgi:hypothetical protein
LWPTAPGYLPASRYLYLDVRRQVRTLNDNTVGVSRHSAGEGQEVDNAECLVLLLPPLVADEQIDESMTLFGVQPVGKANAGLDVREIDAAIVDCRARAAKKLVPTMKSSSIKSPLSVCPHPPDAVRTTRFQRRTSASTEAIFDVTSERQPRSARHAGEDRNSCSHRESPLLNQRSRRLTRSIRGRRFL